MKKIAVILTFIFLTSLISGCTGNNSSTEKDERISELESELSNITTEAEELAVNNNILQLALLEAQSSLDILNEDYSNLSSQLAVSEWHKSNLTFSLSEAMELLNNSENIELISSLETQIINLTSELNETIVVIMELNSQILFQQEQIDELTTTVTALESTISSLSYNIREKISSCPLDNQGNEIAVGFDDGDGELVGTEVIYTIGECPGNSGTVSNIQNNSGGYGNGDMVTMGGNLYFAADDGIHGWELWRSDGTVAGTSMVVDLRDGDNGGSMVVYCWNSNTCHYPEIVAGNDKIFFTGFNGEPGTETAVEVFVSDGTEAGTNMAKRHWWNWDVATTSEEGWNYYPGPRNLLIIPGNGFIPDRVVYTALDVQGGQENGAHPPIGEELWISDGTELGTTMLANIQPEDESWESDGTTYCCGDFQGGAPLNLLKKGNAIWFTANSLDYGRELYRYDLAAIGGGLFLVSDILTGSESSNPEHLTAGGNGVYFSAFEEGTGRELYHSSGDAFSTFLLKDIWPGMNNSSDPMQLTKFGNYLVFTADDGQNGRELWITDKTEQGTYMVKNINTNGSSDPYQLHVLDGILYFTAEDENHGRELWKSDGTEVGTTIVKDINPGNNSSYYWVEDFITGDLFIIHQGELYFGCDDGTHGVEVCRSDGTSEGTTLAVDATPGENSSWPLHLTSMGEKVFFTAYNDEQGRQLWYLWDNPGPVIG